MRNKSPIPERPASVLFFAFIDFATVVISAKLLEMIEATALSPYFFPTTIPLAMAYIFFSAPAICDPIMSLDKYGLKVGDLIRVAIFFDTSSCFDATAVAAGNPFAISAAKFGPEIIAILFFWKYG